MITNFLAGYDLSEKKVSSMLPTRFITTFTNSGEAIWEEINMDFIVRLPKLNGYDAILVVLDRLSKYGHFVPLKHPYSARSVVEVFTREVVKLHGIPTSIVSD